MKTAIIYAYFENNKTLYNLDFFIQVGLINDPNYIFVFVINGFECSVHIPNNENCVVISRENTGFDFGAHRIGIDYLLNKHKCSIMNLPYDNFIFMNCGVIGPFLPTYYPKDMLWPSIFTSKLNDKVKLVGTSLVTFAYNSYQGAGPFVEGFCFCLDKLGLNIVYNTNTVFTIHNTKEDAIHGGEYGLSKAIRNAGYTLDCLLYKYQNIDWSNKENWINQNNHRHPSRSNTYDGITIHPFEVVFHKWHWMHHTPVNFNYVMKYKKWKITDIIKTNNNKFYACFGIGEYAFDVTKFVMDNYYNDGIIIIPTDYHDNPTLAKISNVLNEKATSLSITIKNFVYTIKHIISDKITIYVDNKFDLSVVYGCYEFNIDVTNKFINTFIKNNKIFISKHYNLNNYFNDVAPGVLKCLFMKIKGVDYRFYERCNDDFEMQL